MHPNPAFRGTPQERNLAFARARGFGALTVNGAEGPLIAHVPFLFETPDRVTLHLARSNPIARAALPMPAVIAVSGPDAYISPDWYGVADQVPTWNYIAVHLRGTLHPLPDDALRRQADGLSAEFEQRLTKTPWTSDKMGDGVMERMMRAILPFRLDITDVQGTWKLNQNKTPEARAGVIAALEQGDAAAAAIAALMRGLDDPAQG
jgi:transcriptional regulator